MGNMTNSWLPLFLCHGSMDFCRLESYSEYNVSLLTCVEESLPSGIEAVLPWAQGIHHPLTTVNHKLQRKGLPSSTQTPSWFVFCTGPCKDHNPHKRTRNLFVSWINKLSLFPVSCSYCFHMQRSRKLVSSFLLFSFLGDLYCGCRKVYYNEIMMQWKLRISYRI